MPRPLPSTARFAPHGQPYVEPHSESHVVDGRDTVWGHIDPFLDYAESGDLSQIDIGDTADGGTNDEVARADHQHEFPAPAAGYPLNVAATESDGVATTPARSDHVHAHETAHIAHDTLFDAKGDLVAGTGADTAAKVTVGADNTVLMADAAQATGVKWSAQSGLDHGSLGGLLDDDHTQYIKDTEFTEAHSYLRGTGSGTFGEQKNNFAATAAPTANEDSGDAYSVGSRWIDTTNDKEYVCLDATLTAAVWTETTQASSSGGAIIVQKDNVEVDPNVETMDFEGDDFDVTDGTDEVVIALARKTSVWMPDAPPASAGADDDEFADASGGVPSGWTEVDHGAVTVVDEDEAGLELFQATHAADAVGGIYKAIPAGDFSIWTKLSLSGVSDTNFVTGGLALWEDATTSTADLYHFYISAEAVGVAVLVSRFNAYNSFNSVTAIRWLNLPDAATSTENALPSAIYMRIRRASTTYVFDISTDGLGWTRIHAGTLAITPTHYGPSINNINSGVNSTARFPFFRYVASDVGINGLMFGDRVKVLRN